MKQITHKNYSEVMPEAKVAIQEFTQNVTMGSGHFVTSAAGNVTKCPDPIVT